MRDDAKSREQLIDELIDLRRQLAELKDAKAHQQRAKAALQRERDHLRVLMDSVPDTIYFKDTQGRFTRINAAQADVLGVDDPSEAIGRTDFDYFTPDHARDAYADEQRIIASGQPVVDKVERIRRADGDFRWVSTTKVPITASDGSVTGIVGITRDVTERKEAVVEREAARDALEDQLARVRLLNRIARGMAAHHDLDSILRVVAQRLEETFTDIASIWLREDDTRILRLGSGGDRYHEAAAQASRSERTTLSANRDGQLMKGRRHYIPDTTAYDNPLLRAFVRDLDVRSVVIVPFTADGDVRGLLVSERRAVNAFSAEELDFLSDLAVHVGLAVQQARLHQEIHDAYDDLRQTQEAVMQQERLQALGAMASGIAHDINNAIAPIPLYASMIGREASLGERTRAHLRTIKTAVSDIEETVARMRQFYRHDERPDAMQPLDVNRVVRDAVELTRPRWRDVPQERGITIDLRTDLQDDLLPVLGFKGEIRQAVTNLILNAVQAMPNGGTLSVRTRIRRVSPPRVVVEVTDTGVGMDEDTRRRCFEPFFSTKGERGSGMGLATVYGTMQRHNGDVHLRSSAGRGTSVRLIFPVCERVEETGPDEIVAPAPPLRILCIDDEPLLRDALKETLENEGHHVELADDGTSGLSAFRAARERGQPFDVVITDLGMPHIDGREVTETVKSEAPETPVILLTGWGVLMDAENDVPEDVDIMLGKPPSVEALNNALARVTPGD